MQRLSRGLQPPVKQLAHQTMSLSLRDWFYQIKPVSATHHPSGSDIFVGQPVQLQTRSITETFGLKISFFG